MEEDVGEEVEADLDVDGDVHLGEPLQQPFLPQDVNSLQELAQCEQYKADDRTHYTCVEVFNVSVVRGFHYLLTSLPRFHCNSCKSKRKDINQKVGEEFYDKQKRLHKSLLNSNISISVDSCFKFPFKPSSVVDGDGDHEERDSQDDQLEDGGEGLF